MTAFHDPIQPNRTGFIAPRPIARNAPASPSRRATAPARRRIGTTGRYTACNSRRVSLLWPTCDTFHTFGVIRDEQSHEQNRGDQ